MHPLWQNAAGPMQQIRPAPPGTRLWYDTRDVPFLREDEKDQAEIAGSAGADDPARSSTAATPRTA
jgi:hypothetical protein